MSESDGPAQFARVVIAIVATDEQTNIVNCLQSLSKSEYRNFRVVICENAGADAFKRDIDAIGPLEKVTAAPRRALDQQEKIHAYPVDAYTHQG